MVFKNKDDYIYKSNGRYFGSLEKEHLPRLKSWRNAQMKILRQYTPLSNFHQQEWYAHVKKDQNQVLFSIMINEPGKLKFIGYCGITNIDFKNRRGEISFLVETERNNHKQILKRDFLAALHVVCKYGFEELNLNKIFTETYEFRKDIIKCLEKFGFQYDGRIRQHQFISGRYYSSLVHSLLASEWKKYASKIS